MKGQCVQCLIQWQYFWKCNNIVEYILYIERNDPKAQGTWMGIEDIKSSNANSIQHDCLLVPI